MKNFFINNKDKNEGIKTSKKKLEEILSNKLIHAEVKTLSKKDSTKSRILVEEGAVEAIKIYLWEHNYWVLREQQNRGPTDLYAYKIINGKK